MTSKTPETLEQRKKFVRALSLAQLEAVDAQGEAVIEREADALLADFTTTLEAAKREARIDEVDLLGKISTDKQVLTVAECLRLRRNELSHPQPEYKTWPRCDCRPYPITHGWWIFKWTEVTYYLYSPSCKVHGGVGKEEAS